MSHVQLVERYYDAIDDGDGETLASVLAPEFRHDRPDRTLDGRERFVEFMLEERPRTDTGHAVDTVFLPQDQNSDHESHDSEEVVVHGRLIAADGEVLFAFVDLFTVGEDGIQQLRTFTR